MSASGIRNNQPLAFFGNVLSILVSSFYSCINFRLFLSKFSDIDLQSFLFLLTI